MDGSFLLGSPQEAFSLLEHQLNKYTIIVYVIRMLANRFKDFTNKWKALTVGCVEAWFEKIELYFQQGKGNAVMSMVHWTHWLLSPYNFKN